MTRSRLVWPVAVAAMCFTFGVPALADVTGLDAIHEQRREGGRICMTDHFHYGSSNGLSSKRAALAAAIKSWADFTDFEYGSTWASWARSASKQVSCSGGSSWGCDISSRPCRP